VTNEQITWEEQIALQNGKIIGYYITDQTDVKYSMVFFHDSKPVESTATSERQAREWIISQTNGGKGNV